MRSLILKLEGHSDSLDVGCEDVEEAILKMSLADGPTFVLLEDQQGNYMQAAGTNRAYVVEARDVYGEGFSHWRAASEPLPSGSAAKVYYMQSCPKRKHLPRQCPITVDATQILGLNAVAAALLAFRASGERFGSVAWHDVTSGFLERHREEEDNDGITDILPRSRDI
jgi:hypothetical protein